MISLAALSATYQVEFTYARSFGSAGSVNMLGYAALIIEGLSDNIPWYQLKDELRAEILDVRTMAGKLADSKSIPSTS